MESVLPVMQKFGVLSNSQVGRTELWGIRLLRDGRQADKGETQRADLL